MPQSQKLRPSSTPGISKGDNCHRSQIKNLYAKDARFYKKDILNYIAACKIVNGMKGNQVKSGWIEDYEREQQNK